MSAARELLDIVDEYVKAGVREEHARAYGTTPDTDKDEIAERFARKLDDVLRPS